MDPKNHPPDEPDQDLPFLPEDEEGGERVEKGSGEQTPETKLEPVESNPSPSLESGDWRRTLFWMFALLVVAGAGLYVFKSLRDLPKDTVTATMNATVQAITNVSRSLAALASQFNHGSITLSMNSTGTKLADTKYFQFKKINQLEIFTHRDQASTGFGYIPLPEVVVEARAPVDYTYYLNLDATWRMEINEEKQVVDVFTPSIHFNKPAVDVSRMEYEVKKGSVLRDVDDAMDNLKKSISSLSYIKAQENLELVRETGRKPVEEFVRQWLIQSYTDASRYQVRVFFPGETPPELLSVKPTEDP